MTDLIPLIVEDNGDGTGKARRIADDEVLAFARRLLDWLPENSVLMKGGNGTVGAIRIFEGQMLGRDGTSSIDSLDAAQVADNLGLPELLAAKSNAGHAHEFIEGIADIDWSTLGDGRVLAREGGEFVWIPTPTGGPGGTGGVSNPLGGDLDLGGNALVDGDTEIVKVQDGTVYLFGKEVFEFDVTGAEEGFTPRFSVDDGKYVGGRPKVGDLVGGTPGKFLAVGEDLRVEEVDAPSGGSAPGGSSTPASGTAYPAGPTTQSSVLRTDLVRHYVYRDDLAIKYADSDSDTLQGWVATSERSMAFRRTDLDLNRDPGYIVGDGFNAGLFFPTAAVIRRMSMTVGANTSGNFEYRIHPHPSNSEGVAVRTVGIAGPAASDEPWIVIPANSILSLYGDGWEFATREINLELIVSDFDLDDAAAPQTT